MPLERLKNKWTETVQERERRLYIKACLARHGLGTGPRLFKGSDDTRNYLERVVAVLTELGPVFIAYGRYLGTRYDCFPAADCITISATGRDGFIPPNLKGPLNPESSWEGFNDLVWEPAPIGEPMLRYHSTLSDGRRAALSLADESFQRALQKEGRLLSELTPTLSKVWPSYRFNSLYDDFLNDTLDILDHQRLMQWLEGWETHRNRMADIDLEMPLALPEICTKGLYCTVSPPGQTLAHILANGSLEDRVGFSRVICLAWLHRALVADWFPLNLNERNIVVLHNRRLMFAGWGVATLTKPEQTTLMGYLMRVAANEPENAFHFLITLLDSDTDDHQILEHRLRQLIPFRDGGWGQKNMAESLGEHLFVQWRTAWDLGYSPQPALRNFCLGLSSLALLVNQISPERDVLKDALYEFRLKTGIEELRGVMGFENITDRLEQVISMMSMMPGQFERLVSQKDQPFVPSPKNQKKDREIVPALVITIAAVAILSGRFSQTAFPMWMENVTTILFLVFGGLLLRFLIRA